MQLEFNFPISMTCIHYTTLHLRIPKREKMLVKLPHLTRQHHLPNQHGAKNRINTKMQIHFFRCNCNRTCCYTDRFFHNISNLLSKKLYFMKIKKKQELHLFIDNIQDTIFCLELFRMNICKQ